MSIPVIRAAARRMAEHVREHQLTDVRVVLHGGEPLLAGPDLIAATASILRNALPAETSIEITIQTNGLLLDEKYLALLLELGIGVGVSIDGTAQVNDRRRHRRNGQGSHAEVARALRLLGREIFRPIFRGLLCTIDLSADPLSVYHALSDFAPPAVDFLLPHGNWSNPPPGRSGNPVSTPYADWLVAIFDHWYPAPSTPIRLFEGIIGLLLGLKSGTEAVGLSPSTLVVVETDGSIEQVPALKSVYDGAAATGAGIYSHGFDSVLTHPGIAARQAGKAALHDQCMRCPVRDICGGGFYPHRYHADTGFRNPSVYCPDLLALIGHVREKVLDDLSPLRLER
jgi:uncharacterized protein